MTLNRKQPDHYTILRLPRDASIEDINQAYRILAKKYHPDVPKGDEENFKLIAEAYRVLRDERERERYDSTLQDYNRGYKDSPAQLIFDEQFSAYFLGVGLVYTGIIFALFFMLDFFHFILISVALTIYGIMFFFIFKKLIN